MKNVTTPYIAYDNFLCLESLRKEFAVCAKTFGFGIYKGFYLKPSKFKLINYVAV